MFNANPRSMVSFGGFALLYLLLFLHICTAFLTVINALNDREEILQLSVDTFHVLTSEESRPKLTIDDQEEKELLLALLTSYDDLPVKASDLPTLDPSAVPFLPSSVHFSAQPLAIPRLQTFRIVNDEAEPLQIFSITGGTNEFYSSTVQSTVISPRGGNLSMNIYYLPRTSGYAETTFVFRTNRGEFSCHISGFGTANPYRLRPLVNIEIPLNVTYEHTLQFHNPYNHSLHITEIYTSDESLIIELLAGNNPKNRLTKASQYHEQWYLNAYETKSIVKIQYSSARVHLLNGFICIKTNLSEKLILPVEIRVSNRSDLYSNIDLLEFSSERFLRSDNKTLEVPLYALNYASDPVTIIDIRVPSEYQTFLRVQQKNLPVPPSSERWHQIADLRVDLHAIPRSLECMHGAIEISTPGKAPLTIPFDERIYHGALDWSAEETEIFLSNRTESTHCQSIRVYNRFQTVISVSRLAVDRADVLSKFVQIQYPSSNFYLYPNQWSNLLCLTFSPQSKFLSNIQTEISLSTNLSDFHIPIHLYNGLLELDIVTDQTNGGPQRSELHPLELLVSSIPVNTSRSVRFVLVNSNPIDIEIEKLRSNLDIRLDYMRSLGANQTNIRSDEKEISSLIIPKQHQAIFLVTINGTNATRSYDELLTVETNSQILSIHVKYEITNSSVELVNETPLHLDVYPHRLASTDLSLFNKFHIPIQLTRIHFLTYGVCFSFTSNHSSIEQITLRPNQIQKIGRLNFDLTPLCHLPAWKFYCQFNQHLQQHSDWNAQLVEHYRNLSSEWRDALRSSSAQRIQTNLWIYSDRVTISSSVTVNFLWPSVIEGDSTTVDFQVTSVNSTKTERLTIRNPIADIVEYSIEFLTQNHSSFSISTAAGQIDQIYRFKLHPHGQMNLTVSHHPRFLRRDHTYLIVRNNFTRMESIALMGEGGIGNLQIGSSVFPIVLEINPNQEQLCSNLNGNPVLEKIVTLRNTGNLMMVIHDLYFGALECTGQGFSVPICRDIRIEANAKYNLLILYQPDYTSDEINETMILNTNIGQLLVPISVRIPQEVLSACYKAIPRPLWQVRSYCLCLCALCLVIILIFLLAVFDARKSYDNYLIRLEWRDHIQISNNKIFDLKDLSLAIHDEQKPREPIETLQANDEKKEQPKPKRSFNASRAEKTNPKARRATVDSGVAKSTKQPPEMATKPEPLRAQKSEEKRTSVSTRPRSSTTVSEEEHEPFIVPRAKRASNKRKGSFTALAASGQSFEENDLHDDQQWQTVSSNRGAKKGNLLSRRENSDEAETPKTSEPGNAAAGNQPEQLQQVELVPSAPVDTKPDRSRSSSERDEETIDWDEPDVPDEDFGRYASQTEHSMDETNEGKPIPPLMSLKVTTTPPVMPTKSSTVTKENIEPLPFPQHKPGPIQRPMHLPCASLALSPSASVDAPPTPNTPDVLVQINHLVDHQNSLSNASALSSDLPTPSVSWTPFTPTEWTSTWSTTAASQNPFVQRQLSKDEATLWASANSKDAWLKFSPATEPGSDPNWNLSSALGWPKGPSDENNNNDKSRWDFAH